MRGFDQTAALLLLLAGVAPAGEPALRREGAFWVWTETGTQPTAPKGPIRIAASGGVKVTGAAEDQIAYSVTRRVRARSESDARRLMVISRTRISIQGKLTTVRVDSAAGEVADLEIRVPRAAVDIVVNTHDCAVDVSDLSGAVHTETGAGKVTIDRIGGAVTALTAGGDVVLGTVGGAVRCISGGGPISARNLGGEAFLQTAGGDITVEQVDGPVRCSTAAGGIRIERAGSTVVADTMGGPIDIVSARGLVTIRNSGGPIAVGSASGGARCESAGGTIRLTQVAGGLRASTAVGNIAAHLLAGEPFTDSFLTTGAGDITLWIPSKLRVTVRAQNETPGNSRRIVSEFAAIPVKSSGLAVSAEGSLNGGGPLVRLVSTGGTIYIRRDK
jgi:DUF4097 and DUF4098 domain-containing protein YvlB